MYMFMYVCPRDCQEVMLTAIPDIILHANIIVDPILVYANIFCSQFLCYIPLGTFKLCHV